MNGGTLCRNKLYTIKRCTKSKPKAKSKLSQLSHITCYNPLLSHKRILQDCYLINAVIWSKHYKFNFNVIYSMNMPCYFQCGHLYREKWICSSHTHLKTVWQFLTFEICLHFNIWRNKQASAHSKNIKLIGNIYSHDLHFLWKTCLQLKRV